MKVIIFDVNNAACSLVIDNNWYSMMIDCWSNSEKPCPVDIIRDNWVNWNMKTWDNHYLTMLHVTHPDDDHIRNSKKVFEQLNPYILFRSNITCFSDIETMNKDYINLDNIYNCPVYDYPCRWRSTKSFSIKMDVIKNNEILRSSEKNNSSIIRRINYQWFKILFWWDLESEWRKRLAENDEDFRNTMSNWIDILIAPHHWHKSWFPIDLFNIIWNVRCVIHSKWWEGNIEWSDVASQYGNYCTGVKYLNKNDLWIYVWKVLTTRSNWQIEISVKEETFEIITEKASSNHQRFL